MTKNAEQRSRGKIKIAVAVVIVLAFASLAALYLINRYLNPSHNNAHNEPITEWAAKAVPDDTQVFFAGNLSEMGVPALAQAEFVGHLMKSENLTFLSKEIVDNSGITLKDDILPWLVPEACLAVKMSVVPGDMAEAGFVPVFSACCAVRVRDESSAQKTLDKISQSMETNGVPCKRNKLFNCDVFSADNGLTWTLTHGYLYLGLKPTDLEMLLKERAQGKALADNADYNDALNRFKTSKGAVFYCNLSDIIGTLALYDGIKSERMSSFVKSLRYFAAAGGVLDNKRLSGAYLAADPNTMGDIGKQFFSNSYNIRFDSFSIHPQESDMYAGVNIKMLWDYSVLIMQETENGFALGDLLVMVLSKSGIDFDKDVLGNLTGELAYSCMGCGKAQAENTIRTIKGLNTAEDAASSAMQGVDAFGTMPVLISVGYKDQDKFNVACDKIEPLKQLMVKAKVENYEGTPIYKASADDDAPYFAFTKQAFLLDLNDKGNKIKGYLKNGNSGTLSSLPAFSAAGFLDADKTAAAIAYQDLGRFYNDLASEMAKDANVDESLVKAVRVLSNLYGVQYGQLTVRSDGLCVSSVLELK
ncbi:MAG: DUF3352 domain-containing protein [bacterium]|nr:DUF3352 domain-containing protein [bacterium]